MGMGPMSPRANGTSSSPGMPGSMRSVTMRSKGAAAPVPVESASTALPAGVSVDSPFGAAVSLRAGCVLPRAVCSSTSRASLPENTGVQAYPS